MIKTVVLAMLLTAIGSGARAGECDRFAIEVATSPVPYQYPRGLEKSYALRNEMPGAAEVILIGDSLAANWPGDMARRQFNSAHVWNFAVGGSVTQNTLWQIGHSKADRLKPHDVVLLVGTNNLTREDMPACAIAAGIEAVAMAAHAQWPTAKIHLMGIPPRGQDFHFRDDVRLAINLEVGDWARDLAYLHYFEADAAEISCGLYDRPLRIVSAAGATPACVNYADDFGHFQRPGYALIFSSLMRN